MLSAHVHIICLSSLALLIFHYNFIPAPRNSKTQKVKETRLISQKVK